MLLLLLLLLLLRIVRHDDRSSGGGIECVRCPAMEKGVRGGGAWIGGGGVRRAELGARCVLCMLRLHRLLCVLVVRCTVRAR